MFLPLNNLVYLYNEQSKVSKNTMYCSVFGCKSFYLTDKSVSFQWFPKVKASKVLWTNKYVISELIDKQCAWAINLKMTKESLKKVKNLLQAFFR